MTVDQREDGAAAPTTGSAAPVPGPTPSTPPATHRRLATALVVASYVALAVIAYWSAWSSGVTTHMQVGGDQFANVWFLRWTPFALLHGHNPLLTDYANYPFGVNMVTNTSAPFLGLLGMPITLLAGSIATFNVLCTVALAGSATAGYVLARRFTRWRPAAWVAGLVYGFSPYQIGQGFGHLNLTFVVFPPLILLAVHEVMVRQQRRARTTGIVLGLLVTAQFFVSSEILASTVVVTTSCVVAVVVIGHRSVRAHLQRAVVGTAWAAGVAAVLLAYPVWLAVEGPDSISGPIQLIPQVYRADLYGLVYPGAFVWLAPSRFTEVSSHFAGNGVENGSYLGITLVLTVVVSVVVLWRRSPAVRVAAVGGTVAFVLSLGASLVVDTAPGVLSTGFPLPERIFTELPLLSNTIPVRYSLYVALFAALVLALALDRLHDWCRGRARPPWLHRPSGAAVVPGVLAVVCLLPLVPTLPLGTASDPGIPSFFTSSALRQIPEGSVALLYPFPSSTTPEGQLWQAQSDFHFKMPGGYFLVPQPPGRAIAFSPATGYTTNTLTSRTLIALEAGTPPPETPALRAALGAQLRSWHVRTLIASLPGVADPTRSLAFLTWLAGNPTSVDGVLVWLAPTFTGPNGTVNVRAGS